MNKIQIFAIILIINSYNIAFSKRLEDRTHGLTPQIVGPAIVPVIENLKTPPGNIAVSKNGRVFITLHPEAKPDIKVGEIVNGVLIPFPNADFQKRKSNKGFRTPLSLRIDSRNRIWVLDYAKYGLKRPELTAFDINNGEILHQKVFSIFEAGIGSLLNDFQVDEKRNKIYITDTAPFFPGKPAIIVYDIENKTIRRTLVNHHSVRDGGYDIYIEGTKIDSILGFTPKFGANSIALDRLQKWLYFAPMNAGKLFRVNADDLTNINLSSKELSEKVEEYATITMSDGITTDNSGNIYISDIEHSAILSLNTFRKMELIAKDKRLRWPDGFSFGPGGWIYVTCSSLHNVIYFKPKDEIIKAGPYQVYKFNIGTSALPGH